MRKAIIEIELYEEAKEGHKWMFEHIRSFEVLEVLKVDHVEGLFVDLIEVQLKEGASILELDSIGDMEILSVVRSEGDRHTCLVKGHESDMARDAFKELDLIYTAPSLVSEDRIVISFISAQKDLMRFVEMVRGHIGKVTKMTLKEAKYQRKDILSVLTDRQREIMFAAYAHGYYDIPKKISSERLAQRVDLSRPTLLEHLRKAERRILSEIMAGYSE